LRHTFVWPPNNLPDQVFKMLEDKLDEGAEYGAFPFDYYIAVSVFLT
jgi:hypothetical protein